MNKTHNMIHRINSLNTELNALYHQAALKLDLSDSALYILYIMYYKGDSCPLNDICRESGISKQTINSALRKLEAEGILYMANDRGRSKRVCLTDKGIDYVAQTGARIFEAECRAFSDWSEEEVELYLRLMEKYNHSFAAQLDRL